MSIRRYAALIIVTACFFQTARSQTVELQGTVHDRYGSQAAIPDAEVTLLKAALTGRTDAQGRFHLVNNPTSLGKSGLPGPGGSRWMPGRGLVFRNATAGRVSVRILTPGGRSVYEGARARLGAGTWTYNPPPLENGVYILSLATPALQSAASFVQLGAPGQPAHPASNSGFQPYGNPVTEARALAKSGAAIDSLRVSKAGFFVTQTAVPEYVHAGLAITLADTTSSTASLKALFPSAGNLQPVFQPGLFGYAMIVRESVSVLGFTAITAPANPFITIRNGTAIVAGTAGIPSEPIGLGTGANTIEVEALSRDSTAHYTYRIQVHRVLDASAALTGLASSPGALTPAFAAGTFNYALTLASGTTNITLTPSAQPLSVIRINGNTVVSGRNSPPVTVRVGTDTVPVEVTSPDGSMSAKYLVITNRAADTVAALPSLASLYIAPAAVIIPAFNPATTKYDVWYPAGTAPITLVATAANPGHQVAIQGRSPSPARDSASVTPGDSGTFAYGITVSDANGANPGIYTLTVHKGGSRNAEMAKVDFSPAYISISPLFSKTISQFTVLMNPADSQITVTPAAVDPTATIYHYSKVVPAGTGVAVKVNAKPSLTPVNFSVRAQDGITKREYIFSISRYPVLGQPQISGPVTGFKDAVYSFLLTPPPGCKNYSTTYSADFGDGTPPVTGSFTDGILFPNKINKAYAAAGTYAYKLRGSCNQMSEWSETNSITVLDPGQGGKYRQISGPRSASETWYKDTLYLITAPTLFEKATTLTIQPGTQVSFVDTSFYLMITGNLSAVGTATDSIRFDRANIRLRWNGPMNTYNPDGSYLAGPRFEYCSIPDGYIYMERTDTDGKWGPYLKHSRVKMLTGEFFKYSNGSYIDHCRIDQINGLRLMNSRVLNSHIGSAVIIADKGTPMKMNKCEIPFLILNIYDFTNSDISGNTLQYVQIGSSTPGTLQGNNILLGGGEALRAGTGLWNMQQNFWGDSATAEMAAKGPNQNITGIRDYYDDLSLGKMDYSNWKTAPIPDAKPDW